MKKIIISTILISFIFASNNYKGCILNKKIKINYGSYTVYCINGFEYFEFDRGIAPLFNKYNKKLIQCNCKRK